MKTRREFGTLLLSALATSAWAIDWPQWRGPNQDGFSPETGLLQNWPEGGPKLIWSATGLGDGHATVSTAGENIVTSGDLDGAASVICLSARDGKKKWSTAFGKAGGVGWGKHAGPRAEPTIDMSSGLVFALAQFGEAAAVSLADGRILWKKSLTTDFGGAMPEWGYAEAPVVDGDRIIFSPGGPKGAVIALEKKSGKLLWRTEELTDSAQYPPAVMATIDGVKQYVQLTEKSVVGINPSNGKLLWRAERLGKTAVIPTPIVYGNLVYVTSGYQIGSNCFEVRKRSETFEATLLYATKTMQNHHGGVIRVGEYVYGMSEARGFVCQEIKSGKEAWFERTIPKGSIAYADNRFILRQEEGRGSIILIEATPAGCKERGRFDQPNRTDKNSWAHPVVSNGRMYIRDQETLYCYDISAKT